MWHVLPVLSVSVSSVCARSATEGDVRHARRQHDDTFQTVARFCFRSRCLVSHAPARYNALDEASARKEAAVAGEKKQEQVDEASPAPTLAITKFASVRGLSAYFCRDAECYR